MVAGPIALDVIAISTIWPNIRGLLFGAVLLIAAGQIAVSARWTWWLFSVVGLVFGLAIAVLVIWSNACFGMNSRGVPCVPHGVPFPAEMAGLAVFGLTGVAQALTFGERERGGWWVLANAAGGLACGIALDVLPVGSAAIGGGAWGLATAVAATLIRR
ncbi:MAG TPA: hypothetical protein VFB69_03175 [Candidatus Dormibacteraeota bacterium]|nr:hypothetical protein [Candidatus Dormibacteraeota bacterium]